MLPSTSFAYPRQAPPVRPSRSLEGLERVIPPKVPQPPARPTLKLDKPLPELPSQSLPEPFVTRGRTAWSDDSSTISSVDSQRGSQSAHSTESYPVFVRAASDDLTERVDRNLTSSLKLDQDQDQNPAPPTNTSIVEPYTSTAKPTATTTHSPGLSSFQHYAPSTENRYGNPPDWAQRRSGPNHYFREKKWDFFPELATPSALGSGTGRFPPHNSQLRKKTGSKLNLSAFDFGRNRSRSNTSDRGTSTLAHEVRDSFRSYVHRTLSKRSVEKGKSKRPGRPATAPSFFYPRKSASSQRTTTSSGGSYIGGDSSPTDLDDQMRTLSISTSSSASERWAESPQPIPVHRSKQLAVPITPYQKYGAAIWDKSGGIKKVNHRQSHNVRFPKYQRKLSRGSTHKSNPISDFTSSNPTPPLSPPKQNTRDYLRVLQDGTSQVLGVLDGAKKKVIGSRIDRRRTELKSQIKLIGPVNPYTTYGRVDPWI